MPSITTTLTLTISSLETEHEVSVEYAFIPACRGARDSLGGIRGAGPPLEPDEPAHCEVLAVTVYRVSADDRVDITWLISPAQIEGLSEDCLEAHEEDAGTDPDDERDRRRDMEDFDRRPE